MLLYCILAGKKKLSVRLKYQTRATRLNRKYMHTSWSDAVFGFCLSLQLWIRLSTYSVYLILFFSSLIMAWHSHKGQKAKQHYIDSSSKKALHRENNVGTKVAM